MKAYREYIENCLLNSEKVEYAYEEHCRQVVLEQLIRLSEMPQDGLIGETDEEQDLLCVFLENEMIEKGMHRNNRPKEELIICAPPALMAVILGEYKLAQKLCERTARHYEDDTAIEILQDHRGPLLKTSQFRFCEACLLSSDMETEESDYFVDKGMFAITLYCDNEKGFFSKLILYGDDKQILDCLLKMMDRVIKQQGIRNSFPASIGLLVCFALRKEIDRKVADFWKDVYGTLHEVEHWNFIIQFTHCYLMVHCNALVDIQSGGNRVLPCIEEYFRHMDCMPMDGYVKNYIDRLIKFNASGKKELRDYCRTYFKTVKRFGSEVNLEWKILMFTLLRKKDLTLAELGFRNAFLKEEWIEEYIEFFFLQKEHSLILPYLIQKKWALKEKLNGNIQ